MWNWNVQDAKNGFYLYAVLIAPMWNWNSYHLMDQEPLASFNRTNVELKLLNMDYRVFLFRSFNRTNVELKRGE